MATKKTYYATAPSGGVYTRTTARTFTHAVVTDDIVLAWCGSEELAIKQFAHWAPCVRNKKMLCYSVGGAHIVPVNTTHPVSPEDERLGIEVSAGSHKQGLGATESEDSDRAVRFLESHKPGQELKVGRHLFTVWRVIGVTVWLTKGGGRKLYQLELLSFKPPTFGVIEISSGSGTPLGEPPVATFAI